MSTLSGPPEGGDQTHAPMLRAVLGAELSIATIIVSLRLFCRLRITRSPGWDDWIMLATFVRCIPCKFDFEEANILCHPALYNATGVTTRIRFFFFGFWKSSLFQDIMVSNTKPL